MPFLIVLAKTLAAAFGQELAEELVCAVAKDCPETVDKIAGNAKEKQAKKRTP